MKIIIYITFIIGLFLFSCKKDRPPVKNNNDSAIIIANTINEKLFICNEGSFGSANGSLSVLYNDSNLVKDVFYTVNNKPLGDVVQSISYINNQLYVVINNSNKIVVLNDSNFKESHVITGFTSPRYILQTDANTAYVSDLYANGINIVDLITKKIKGFIPLKGWTEKMILYNNYVYATNVRNKYLYKINITNNLLTDSILLEMAVSDIQIDKHNNFWILSGDYANNITPYVIYYNTRTNTIIKKYTYSFTTDQYINKIAYNSKEDMLYLLSTNIYKFNSLDNIIPIVPFIKQNAARFYNLYSAEDKLYVTDAKDYTQNGNLLTYDFLGNKIATKTIGLIPGDMLLVK